MFSHPCIEYGDLLLSLLTLRKQKKLYFSQDLLIFTIETACIIVKEKIEKFSLDVKICSSIKPPG